MSRGVEDAMLHLAAEAARGLGANELVANYEPTPRNRPTLEALRGSKLTERDDGKFIWKCSENYPVPIWISLKVG